MDKNVLKKFAIESRQELMEKVANKINRYFIDEEFNVNQNGEVYVLVNDKHTLRLTKSEYENRQLLVKRIKEITLEQVFIELIRRLNISIQTITLGYFLRCYRLLKRIVLEEYLEDEVLYIIFYLIYIGSFYTIFF